MGLHTKTYWLADRQSQWDFDFDFDFDQGSVFNCLSDSGRVLRAVPFKGVPGGREPRKVRRVIWTLYSCVILGVIWSASSCILIALTGVELCVCVCV
jgi:hypothetical protein